MLTESLFYSLSKRAWSAAFPKLDSSKTLAVAFGVPEILDEPSPLQALARSFPRSHLIGCSSSTLMAGNDVGIQVAFLQFEHTTLGTASTIVGGDAAVAGQTLAKNLSKPNLRAVLVFADGITVDGGALIRGFSSLDPSITVFGGLAGDATRAAKGWTLSGGLLKPGMAAAVGLYGDHVVLRTTSRMGWTKLGPERSVTKSDGRMVYELDGKPALAVFDETLAMLGKHRSAVSTITLPFAVRASARHDKSLIRTVMAIDEKNQALRFSVDVPQGYLAQPLSGTPTGMLEAVSMATSAACEASSVVGKGMLAIAVSHAGRQLAMEGSAREEVGAVAEALPKIDPPPILLGMYGYGEIQSTDTDPAQLNNQSFAVASLMESPTAIAQKAGAAVTVGGAIRPQAPVMKAGPAAHLRSKSPTVDDLFSEIELDREAAAPQPRPPPLPMPRPPPSGPRESSPLRRATQVTSRPPAPPQHTLAMSARPRITPESSSGRSSITTTRLKFQSGVWSAPPLGTDSPRTLALLFAPPGSAEAATALARQLPTSHVLGCATERAFGGPPGETFAQLVTFEKTDLVTAVADVGSGPETAAASLAEQLARPGLRALLLFVDGTSGDPDALVRAVRAACPSTVAISGGVVGGKNTWLVADRTVRSGIVVAVGFYGDHVAVGHAARSGFEPFGPERQVTRASDRVVHEIDGRPALQFLMEQIGAASPDAVLRLPLMIGAPQPKIARVVGVPVAVDTSALSVTFGRAIPPGATIRLLRADNEKLLDEVANAAGLAKAQNASTEGPVLLFLASSIVRQRTLGDRIEDQVDAAVDVLPKQVVPHAVGLSSIGEIGLVGTDAGEVHAGIVSLLVLSESPTSLATEVNPAETPSPAVVARTSRPARSQVVRPLLSASGLVSAAAKVTKSRQGDITIVEVSGRLTESFKGEQLGRELSGTVVFDLSKIERVTSFGVREWLQMLGACQERVKKLYFSHCSEAVVNQLSMIRKFGGGAQVLSFFAPYLCDSCGEQFERLFDLESDAEALRGRNAADVMCPQCGGRAHFDDDPETYFAFTPPSLGQPVPLTVRAIHDGIEVASPTKTSDAIDKAIEGNVTRIRATGRAAAVRWQRVFDGSEGAVVVDLGGLSGMDEVSIQSLEQALVQLPAEVDSLRLERCPHLLVESFVVSGVPKKVAIASVTVTGHCVSCNTQRPALVVVDEHLANLAPGRTPTIHCRRCNGVLDLIDPQETLQVLGRHRRRASLTPRLESARPPPVAPVSEAPRTSVPPEYVAPATAPPPAVVVAAAPRSTGVIFASAALVSVALLGSAAAVIFSRRATQPPPPAPAVATASAAWAPVADLPPAWVDRTFVSEAENVYVVGRAAQAKSPEAALETARADAIVQLLKQLHLDLAGAPAHEASAARVRIPADHAAPAPAVIQRFLRHTAGGQQLERGETVVRQRDGGLEAYARYRLARATYTGLVAAYRKTTSFHGITVARLFPLAAPESTDDAIVVAATGRLLEGTAPRPGDIVRTVAGKPFVFSDAVADEWFGAPWGTFLTFEFDRDGTTVTTRVRHGGPVAANFPATRPPAPPPPPSPPPASSQGGPLPLATVYRDPPPTLAKEAPPAKDKDPLGLPALNYRDPPLKGSTPPSKKGP